MESSVTNGFSGVVLVSKKGEIILSEGYGWADRKNKIPNSPSTVFNIGSVTKQFTASAILKLVEQGKIKTSDIISTYFSQTPIDKSDITIHQLLTQTITDLELPFEDDWYIFVGGRTHLDAGHHFITRGVGQRYAYDIAIVIDNSSYSGDSKKNEDHYCFGKRLNAPGNGKIIALENNIDDNYISGTVNSDIDENTIAGNYIMIDHLNGEYSMLAHFKKGTIIVSVGDTVIKGQEVGKTGNSGNSMGTHLHYHIQNTPEYLDGVGLPAQFQNYYADDVLIERGEPVKRQFVRKD